MNRTFYILVSLIAVVQLSLFPAQAVDENGSNDSQLIDVVDHIEKTCAKLEDKEYDVRMAARWDLASVRRILADDLVAKLRSLSQKPDCSYGSALHLTIQTIGEWRVAHAALTLSNMIDYQLDKSTIPEGKTISSRSYFPAAMALVEIGGPNVRDAILQRLGTEDGEKVTRLCVWTLLKTYGEDVTTFLLDRVEAGTKDEAIKQRMKKAKELFAQGDRLLLFDEKPQGTDKETTPAPPAEGESAPAGENYSTPPTSEETPLARDGSAPSSPPIVSSRPTGTSDAAPNATDTGTSSQGGAEGPVAEAAPFPWTIAIVAAVAALAVGAITSLLLTRRKKA